MSTTDADIAASFYGGTMAAAKATAPAPVARSSDQDLADALFGATTKSKPEQHPTARNGGAVDVHNDAEMGELMFKDSPIFESPKLAIQTAAVQEFLADPAEAAEIASSWEPTMRAYSLNSTEASELTGLGVSMTVNPPDAETSLAWEGDAKSALRDDFGNRAGEALQAAQRLVARDPALGQWLEKTGLGNHPKFVRIAAAKAMSLKARGKL